MTDNEQGYTPTIEELRKAWMRLWNPEGSPTKTEKFGARFDRAIAAHDAATLASHRVTLVADSREALARGIFDKHEAWRTAAERDRDWVDRSRLMPFVYQGFYELVDALLASGVVQVTTPTETDEAFETILEPIYVEAVNGQLWRAQFMALVDATRSLLASRPAPVAPPTEESPQESARRRVRGALDDLLSAPVVPVDALGFPTQVGATFRAVVRGFRAHRKFTVLESSMVFRYMDAEGGCWLAVAIDHTSIEDVRPADGRNGK